MESNIHLQNSVQSLAQNQAHPSSDSLSATSTPLFPPASNTPDLEAKARRRERNAELCALSKTFGHIPNIPIFTQWNNRECSDAAVHRSIMAGICGSAKDGTYSVALSQVYKDNEDGGDVIIYTGAGGRERWSNAFPPKPLRVGPQTMDQSWEERPNKALQVSLVTRNPVRVIRSSKAKSKYAPLSGYRYDGLYQVAACWTAKGHNGKNICRCRLERLPDQPPIPLRPITMSTSRRGRERLVSSLSSCPPVSTKTYDVSDGTDVGLLPNQPNVSPGQLESAEGESTGVVFDMDELNPDVKYPLSLAPQPEVSPKPSSPRRYRWDPRNNRLIRIPASDAIAESNNAAGGDEEENRMEGDDATLVSSEHEDGHGDTPMETDYFSDICNADEPRASGSSFMEN